jgi:AAA+ superfamily predicted ATPase
MTLTREPEARRGAVAPFASTLEQLEAELRWLALRLRLVVERGRRRRALGPADEYRGLYVSDEEVDALLAAPGEEQVDLDELQRGADEWRALLDGRAEATRAAGTRLPLDRLVEDFALTPDERAIVVLALAAHIDRGYEKVFAYANDDVTRKRPTVGLALEVLADRRTEAVALRRIFEPDAVLVRHDILAVVEESGGATPSLLARALQLDGHVAATLLAAGGTPAQLDPRLEGIAALVDEHRSSTPGAPGRRLAAVLERRPDARLYLGGRWAGEQRALALAGCAAAGLRLTAVDASALRARPDAEELVRLLRRDSRLLGTALAFERWDDDGDGDAEALGRLVGRLLHDHPAPTFVLGRAARPTTRAPQFDLLIDVADPDYEQRVANWTGALGEDAGDIGALAAAFRFGARETHAAARMARSIADWRGARAIELHDLQSAARLQSQPRLSDVAQHIEARYVWDDIVLPQDRITQLREIALQVLHQHVVYGDWGFAPKASLGRGVSALFVGESGTGKTMAAEVIASGLGLDLYKIDLAGLVSKYIGETEKNLARVFDEAAGANAILFFDEADAVFGKRTEVRDSHDRYANIEVSYLLQKIEEYDGIVVLSSNLRANLDEAFLRRLKAIVDFPFPEESDRRLIWGLNMRSSAPQAEDVDLDFMARQFRIAGGNIKNIAVLGAFLAAGEGSAIAMRHLIHAARREYQKLGRLVTQSDFAEWYEEAQR